MEAITSYAYLEENFPELSSALVKTIDKKLTKKLGEDKPSPQLWDWKWVWNQTLITDESAEALSRKKVLEVLQKTNPEAYVENLMQHKEISFTLVASLRHVKFPKGLEESVKSSYPENPKIPQEVLKHYTPESFAWKGPTVFVYQSKNNQLEEQAVLGTLTKGEQVEIVLLSVEEGAYSVSMKNEQVNFVKALGVLPFQDLVTQFDNRLFRDYKIANAQKALEILGDKKDVVVQKDGSASVSIPENAEKVYLKPTNLKKLKI